MKFIITKEQYLEVKKAWKLIKNPTSYDHYIYNILRGFDPQRGFTKITNQNKLANGNTAWQSFDSAKNSWNGWLKAPRPYKHDTPALTEKILNRYKDTISKYSAKYGVNFTEEIIAQIEEITKC